jgi:hypothetical protein
VFHTLLEDPSFFALLLKIDQEQAELTRAAGCACGGRLDRANYPRKPRGCRAELMATFAIRFSFCCDACRKRTTAMSVRFLGRRVYLGVMVVLSSSRHAGSNSGAPGLAGSLNVPLRTLERWRLWWTEAFVRTPLWRAGCGAFMPSVDCTRLPASLLERFVALDASTRLRDILRFLRPLTVGPTMPCEAARVDHAA